MKIVVVSYDELNSLPDKETVIEDLFHYFCSLNENQRDELGSEVKGWLCDYEELKKAEVIYADTRNDRRAFLNEAIRDNGAQLLVTYNLAGFENPTLTDGLAYNLVDCRQIHIIDRDNLPAKKYMEKLKSINMFFWYRKE